MVTREILRLVAPCQIIGMERILITMILFSLIFCSVYTNHFSAFAENPLPPKNLVAYPLPDKSIHLSWNATSGVMDYTIYRNYSSTMGFVKIASGITDTKYVDNDKDLLEGIKYDYTVTANYAHGESNKSAIASSIPYTPITPLNLGVAFAVSIPVVVTLVLIVYAIIMHIKKNKTKVESDKCKTTPSGKQTIAADDEETNKSNSKKEKESGINEEHDNRSRVSQFWDIIRGNDWFPSLSLFQLFLWTIIIVFSFLFMSIIMFQHGIMPPVNSLNTPMILILLGISVTSPILGNAMSSAKYASGIPDEPPRDIPSFSTMLQEGSKPSITRFQMFIWTWISIIIFLISVVNTVHINWNTVPQLGVPDMNPVLVALMGISQAAYLGGKGTSKTPGIGSIYPRVINFGSDPKIDSQMVCIFGNGFGDKDTRGMVWLGRQYFEYPGDDKDEKRKIMGWEDDRIDLKISKDFTPGSYFVRVTAPGVIVKFDKPIEIKDNDKEDDKNNNKDDG